MASPDGLPFDGLLFDKDGTLLDFDATWGPAAARVARELSGDDARAFAAIAGAILLDPATERLHPDSPLVAGSSADYAALFATPVGLAADAAFLVRLDDLFDRASPDTLTPIGDPAGVLGGLRVAGYRLGMATNDSHAGAVSHSARLGLDGLIEFHAGYDSGHGRKPGPGMVRAFAAHLGASPARVAIVGDSLHDLEAGRAAGARRIAVLSGPASRDTLAAHADHVIDSIGDLAALLASLGSDA